jgi:hypothetical protein
MEILRGTHSLVAGWYPGLGVRTLIEPRLTSPIRKIVAPCRPAVCTVWRTECPSC